MPNMAKTDRAVACQNVRNTVAICQRSIHSEYEEESFTDCLHGEQFKQRLVWLQWLGDHDVKLDQTIHRDGDG